METQEDRATLIRSVPLLWLSLAFLLGIVLASILIFFAQLWLFLAALTSALWFFLRRKPAFFEKRRDISLVTFIVLALFILFLGAARFQSVQRQTTSTSLAHYNDKGDRQEITGLIVDRE